MSPINVMAFQSSNCSNHMCAFFWRGWTASPWDAAALRWSTITPRSSACIPGQRHAGGELRGLCSAGSRTKLDWTDPKYIDAAESYGARGYRSLSMSAVVDEYERCKTQTLTNIWHEPAGKIADWMIAADREKAAKVRWALGERLGLSDQGRNSKGTCG
jgi:hypothetical protein